MEKFLVFNLHFCDLNPTVKMYDILMREFVANNHNSKPVDLEEKWAKMCWSCHLESDSEVLKSCTECKIAKYCGKDCQRNDWKIHKLLHKELERTRHVLAIE